MSFNGNGITPAQQMLSSGAGALLVSLFMTPLDVVKIRLQAQDMLFERKCFLYSNGLMDHLYARVNGDPKPEALHTTQEICNCKWYNRPKYFTGTVDAMVKMSRTEGVSSLWSGLSPTLVLAVPTTVVYFTSYEMLRQKLMVVMPGKEEQKQTAVPTLAGGLARIWAVTLVSPLELVRTKMQSQKMQLSQIREALQNMVRHTGIRGLWKGYSVTLYRDVPFSAIYWPFYEMFRGSLISSYSDEHLFEAAFVSGVLAGTIASTVTLPMDVIKTRRQIEWGEAVLFQNNGGNNNNGKGPTTLSAARDIVNAQGVKGLFAGLTPRILKVAPACAIMISSYEYGKRFFRERNLLASGNLI